MQSWARNPCRPLWMMRQLTSKAGEPSFLPFAAHISKPQPSTKLVAMRHSCIPCALQLLCADHALCLSIIIISSSSNTWHQVVGVSCNWPWLLWVGAVPCGCLLGEDFEIVAVLSTLFAALTGRGDRDLISHSVCVAMCLTDL